MNKRGRGWIAERTLRGGKTRGRLTIRLAKPYEVAESEWVCHVEIRRGETKTGLDVRGSDSFSSLILALKAIRYELDKLQEAFTWGGGETGDSGFPLYVTDMFGLDFTRRLEAIIDAETNRFVARIQRHRKAQARATPRRRS